MKCITQFDSQNLDDPFQLFGIVCSCILHIQLIDVSSNLNLNKNTCLNARLSYEMKFLWIISRKLVRKVESEAAVLKLKEEKKIMNHEQLNSRISRTVCSMKNQSEYIERSNIFDRSWIFRGPELLASRYCLYRFSLRCYFFLLSFHCFVLNFVLFCFFFTSAFFFVSSKVVS